MAYKFYISDQELVKQLETYLQKNKGNAGEVLTISFSPDGRQLASGSGDKTVRFWDLNTQTPLKTCTVTGIRFFVLHGHLMESILSVEARPEILNAETHKQENPQAVYVSQGQPRDF